MAKEYLVRLLSSADHDVSLEELVEYIKANGTDRYDTGRKQMFDNFYAKHNVDFFAVPASADTLESTISKEQQAFPRKTKGDRGKSLVPDIAIIYDAEKCRMIPNVYEGKDTSDCYQFAGSPETALIEVVKL